MKYGILLWQSVFVNLTSLLNNWNIEYANKYKNNNELQRYDNSVINFNNSNLLINTIKNGKDIISGRINTFNKIEIQYGFIEIEMMFSNGIGLWPAFWLLGIESALNQTHQCKWPICGEIDIMEWVAWNEKNIYGTLHGPEYHGINPYGSGPKNILNKSLANEFHKYAIEWKPNLIKWFIDDILFFEASNIELQKINKNYKWIFNDNFYYLIVNMAVGGNFGGAFRDSSNYIYKNLPNKNNLIIKNIKIYKTIDGYGLIRIKNLN
jgi:beta-glucanase (GH16 family)